MYEPARIILEPEILTGKPVIRGTRLSVDFVIGLLAEGWTEADILRNYPGLVREDITACSPTPATSCGPRRSTRAPPECASSPTSRSRLSHR